MPLFISPANAQSVPSVVDPARTQQAVKKDIKPPPPSLLSLEHDKDLIEIPEGAQDLTFTLRSVTIEGMQVYDESRFAGRYKPLIGQTVSAALIWRIAQEINLTYQQDGYFLSKAFVPAQTIEDGIVRIRVVEGYIERVEMQGKTQSDRIVQAILRNITREVPATISNLESNLLRLNDIHGRNYQTVLTKTPGSPEGAVTLSVTEKMDKHILRASSNNYGSKFIGPLRHGVHYMGSLFPYHHTRLTAQTTRPGQKSLASISISHSYQVAPDITLDASFAKTRSAPASTLRDNEIDGESLLWSVGATWTPIRQRTENLSLSADLEFLNSETKALSTRISHDQIRALRVNGNYGFYDPFWGGHNWDLTLSRGLSFFGASKNDDPDISRTGARSDFMKANAAYQYQDQIAQNTALSVNMQGQWANEPLYSSEEFGFGGPVMGRAYDSSEITGDKGVAASVQVQYTGLEPVQAHQVNPFIFYDIGKVWNEGAAATPKISAASAGLGAQMRSAYGLGVDATSAVPLTKSIDNPIHGNGHSPVFRFGVDYSYEF